jgi:hypothetical protein
MSAEGEVISMLEILTLIAIFVGPITAIQVQKFIEYRNEHRSRQLHIFRTLMGTRATRLAPEHVAALNMIDMDFSVKKKKEKPTVLAWRVLLDQFGKYPSEKNYTEQKEYSDAISRAAEKSEDYFVDLLFEMSKSLGYDFEKVHIKNGCYAPTGHAEIENDQRSVRKGLIGLFSGHIPLNMNLQSVPEQAPHGDMVNFLTESANRQKEIIDLLKQLIAGGYHISSSKSEGDIVLGKKESKKRVDEHA